MEVTEQSDAPPRLPSLYSGKGKPGSMLLTKFKQVGYWGGGAGEERTAKTATESSL